MQLSGALLLSTLHPPIHPVAISMLFGSRESRLEQRTKRFDGMIERLTLDSATLTCVDNVRLRAVLRGVGEAGRVPDVRSSFQILYEDMAPIRMAADLIFPRLESTCDEATSQSQSLPKTTSLAVSMDELDAARRLFDAIDADGGGSISREELEESGLLSITLTLPSPNPNPNLTLTRPAEHHQRWRAGDGRPDDRRLHGGGGHRRRRRRLLRRVRHLRRLM